MWHLTCVHVTSRAAHNPGMDSLSTPLYTAIAVTLIYFKVYSYTYITVISYI